MISITCFIKANKISGFEVSGHANYDKKGKDIVCSAVSAIVIGGLNAIKNIDSFDIKIADNIVKCISISKVSDYDQIVIETIMTQLKTIEKEYDKYLQINERME